VRAYDIADELLSGSSQDRETRVAFHDTVGYVKSRLAASLKKGDELQSDVLSLSKKDWLVLNEEAKTHLIHAIQQGTMLSAWQFDLVERHLDEARAL